MSSLYTLAEIKAVLNGYIASHNLVNRNDQSYINIDAILSSTLSSKSDTGPIEFLKRDELVRRLVDKMQAWYVITVEGKEPVIKSVSSLCSFLLSLDRYHCRLRNRKGSLKPISIVVKKRQGLKANTLITDFEPYLLTADFLAEELRRTCASSTSGKLAF
jgi:translation initiation factor 2D